MAKKPRSDSKLASLPGAQRAALIEWLVEDNCTYAQAKAKLAEEFAVKTSAGALSAFYKKFCWSAVFEKSRQAAESLEGLEDSGLFTAGASKAIKQKIFEIGVDKDLSISDLKVVANIIGESAKLEIKRKELALAERRQKLAEEKAAKFDEAHGVMESQLSEEEKGAKIRALFGIV